MKDEAVDELVGILGEWFPIAKGKAEIAKALLKLNPSLAERLDAWGRKHYGE